MKLVAYDKFAYLDLVKYLFLVVSIVSFTFYGKAQEFEGSNDKKVSTFLGSTIAFQYDSRPQTLSSFQEYQKHDISIVPRFGINLSETFSVGLFANYRNERIFYDFPNTNDGDEWLSSHTVGAGLLARQYLLKGTIQIFIEGQFSYARIRNQVLGNLITIVPYFGNVAVATLRPTVSYTWNRVKFLANIGGFGYENYSDSFFFRGEERQIVDEGYSEFLVTLHPRNIRLGAEFLF